MIHTIADVSEITAHVTSDSVSVIDCYAEWCGPCKVLAKSLDVLSTMYPSVGFFKANVEKLDIDTITVGGQAIAVSALPTVIVTKGGKLIDLVVGNDPKRIEDAMKKVM